MVKIQPALEKVIKEYCEKFPKEKSTQLAARIKKDRKDITTSYSSLSKAFIPQYRKANKIKPKPAEAPDVKETKKKGIEARCDNKIVINWDTKTITTDLGEWGVIPCSFDMHNAVQRSYVYIENGGEGNTAAQVAMKFDFPHAKAIHLYAKLHGFTKGSPPQTDVEFESGLSVDGAVQQNLQKMKRDTYKKTEIEKQKWIHANHEKWLDFHHNVLKPFENHVAAHLGEYKMPVIDVRKLNPNKRDRKIAGVLGLSDWHYMKLCYSPDGKVVYDKKIAKERIVADSTAILADFVDYGSLEKVYVPIGNDNIHVDGPEHMTTAGTPQINATDGIWRIGVEEYINITLDYINSIAQIAPVEVVAFPGNHDERTSQLLQVFLKRFYRDSKRVVINSSLHSRLYSQYEKNCLIFTHSHHLGKKLPNQIHKIILGEAKDFKIDLNKTENWLLFGGHKHIGSFEDLNGNVQYFSMPSLSGTDDFWHRGQEYVGRAGESAGYIIDPNTGRKAIVYAR